jgi:receptor protein-tyrosine kinase
MAPVDPTDSSPPSLFDTFAVVRRRWLPIVLLALVLPIISVGYAVFSENRATPLYQANHLLTLNLDRKQGGAATLEQLGLLVSAGEVGSSARAKLGDIGPVHISASVDATRQVLIVSGTGPEAEPAARAANTAAHELIDYLTRRDLDVYQAQVDEVGRRLDAASAQVNRVQAQLDADPRDVQLIAQRDSALSEYRSALDSQRNIQSTGLPEPLLGSVADAEAFRVPIGGYTGLPHYQHAALGVALGLLLGIGLAFVLDALDRRLVSADGAAQAFGLPVLAEIPFGGRSFHAIDGLAPSGSAISEAYRRLRTVLTLEKPAAVEGERATMVILVVSPGPGDGKTTTVAHLARAFGEVGNEVLALSADFRRPRLHKLFGVPAIKGLAGLSEPEGLASGPLVQRTNVPNVHLITAGPGTSDATELIRNTRQVIRAARGRFDFVVVDTSPLLSANDSLDLLDVADCVVIVARYRHTNRSAAARVTNLLVQTTAPTLGVVFTDVRAEAGYGYDYRYLPTPPV